MATTIIPKAEHGQSPEQPGRVPATPEESQRRVVALIERALRLIKHEDLNGDEQSRVLWFAQQEAANALEVAQQVFTHQTAGDLLDQLYDCSSLCLGAAALDPDSPVGAGAAAAAEVLGGASALLDRDAGFWPEVVQSATGYSEVSGNVVCVDRPSEAQTLTPETSVEALSLDSVRELMRSAACVVADLSGMAAKALMNEAGERAILQLLDRVSACNSVVLSITSGDSITLDDAYKLVFGRFGPGFESVFGQEAA
jgi:hypothetical protein